MKSNQAITHEHRRDGQKGKDTRKERKTKYNKDRSQENTRIKAERNKTCNGDRRQENTRIKKKDKKIKDR